MRVETDHQIIERGEHRMVLARFTDGHAFVVAQRQGEHDKWTISTVHENVVAEHARHAATGAETTTSVRRAKEVTAETRSDAVDAMEKMATDALPRDGYSIFEPHTVLSDGSILSLRDKP